MLNNLNIMGRLCTDPELRETQSGIAVCNFRIAVERNYANQDGERDTDFFDVTAWRGTAEVVNKYFTKGRMIAISGRLETQTWADRDGKNHVSVGIVAESVFFADSKKEQKEQKGQSSKTSKARSRRAA